MRCGSFPAQYVKTNKSDFIDAEAVGEAVPTLTGKAADILRPPCPEFSRCNDRLSELFAC